jgi:hypothetical protein
MILKEKCKNTRKQIMKDFSKIDFIDIIDELDIDEKTKKEVLRVCGIPDDIHDFDINILRQPVFKIQRDLEDKLSLMLDVLQENFSFFLQYDECKNWFLNHNKMIAPSTLITNNFEAIYNILKKSEHVSIHKKEYKDFLLDLINLRTTYGILDVEELSPIIKIVEDIFKNKQELGVEFFKEIFALYVENVRTHPEYKESIDKIKEWAIDEDFTSLYPKYKNIRELIEGSEDEQELSTLLKKIDLTNISQKSNISINKIKNNIQKLHLFLTDKLKSNDNFQNITLIDQRSIFKLMITYKEKDKLINSILEMHNDFINTMKKDVSEEDIQSLWLKCVLNSELETNLEKRKTMKI